MDLTLTPRTVVRLGVGAAVLTWATALWLGGGRPDTVPDGLGDPGPVVLWGVRLAETGALLAAVATVGSLLVASHLAPGGATAGGARRTAATAALVWALLTAGARTLQVAETRGLGWDEIGTGEVAAALGPATAGAALVAVAALLALAVLLGRDRPAATGPGWLVVALAAAVALALDGHRAAGDDVLTGALVVHVVAATLWTGGLTALVLHARDVAVLRTAVPRFSRIALACYVSLAGSGLLAATATVPATRAAWTSGYAGVLLAKALVLVVLGAVGVRHRRHTMRRLDAGRPRAFWSLVTGELLLMAVGLGLAAALARTTPPAAGGGPAPHGHLGVATGTDLTWSSLWTAARPNAVVLVVLLGGLACYLASVRSRVGRGQSWPATRTVSAVAGTALALVATGSGLAVHAHTRPSMLVVQLLLVLLVVPALLLAARPADLLPRPLPRPLTDALARPATGAVAVCVVLLTVQYTPVVSLALGSPWWHLLVLVVTAGSGTALWWPTLAAPFDVPGVPAVERAGWLATVALALAVVAARLRLGSDLLASDWFLQVRLSGGDLAADQGLAGLAAAVAAGALALAALAVVIRGSRTYQGRPGGHSRTSTTPRSSSVPTEP